MYNIAYSWHDDDEIFLMEWKETLDEVVQTMDDDEYKTYEEYVKYADGIISHTVIKTPDSIRVKVIFRWWEDNEPYISEWYNSLDEFALEHDCEAWKEWYEKHVNRCYIKVVYESDEK